MLKFSGQRSVGTSFILCCSLSVVPSCNRGNEPVLLAAADGEEAPEPVAVTVFTEKVELFMEYPRLVPGLEARFLAHVTVLASGEPVRSGTLRLELTSESAGAFQFEAASPKRDGLFIPVGSFDAPGTYAARIVVTSEQVEEVIPLALIVVHPDLASAHSVAAAEAQPEPANAVPFLLEQQWKIGMLMEEVELRSLTSRLQVPGEVEAPHHSMAVVSAPLDGRLLPPAEGRLPRIGERVAKGQLLGQIQPPQTASDRALLVSNEASLDALEAELLVREYDLFAKGLEIERDMLLSQAQLDFAEQALTRMQGLRAKDLGTAAELEAAQRDVKLAQQEIAGAEGLLESFALSRERLEQLQEQASARRPTAGQETQRLHPLLAPIDGEVVAATHVQGEHVQALGELYRVLDLEHVWISAHISEFDLGELGPSPGALVEFAAYPGKSLDVLGSAGGRRVHFGRVIDPQSRTVSLRYEVPNPEGLLRAGMFADVYLETAKVVQAVALPGSAIVMDSGRPVAFVLVHGELFQKRELELGIHDGEFVQVLSGLSAGERVVTKGAYLVKLASASPASFGAGHAH